MARSADNEVASAGAGAHGPGGAAGGEEWERFDAAVRERRRLVYDYLENWPGSIAFQPPHIHDAIYSYIRSRGKALRPALVLFCCGAVGGDEAQALPAAAAVEVFHTWTLVHDDIIDRDDTRRGTPTVHARYTRLASDEYGLDPAEAAHYGGSVAILTGDLQQSWAFALLGDLADRGVKPDLVVDAVRRMATELTPHLLEGEMLDVQYSLHGVEPPDDEAVLTMLSRKTAALLQYSAWCGARIGLGTGGDPDGYAEKLARFGYLCGVAFQLNDDLLGLTADERALGKPVGSDLREGKRTLLIARALKKASPADRDLILGALGDASAGTARVAAALAAIERTGALGDVRELADAYIGRAVDLLAGLPDTDYRSLLQTFAHFVIARKY